MYSLWIIPANPLYTALETQISSIADRFRTKSFTPHITLLSQIEGDESELAKLTKRLENTVLPLELYLKGVGSKEHFFQSLYYQFLEDASLKIARIKAAETFGIEINKDFAPHLSLAYGNLSRTAKEALIQKNGFPIGKSHSLCFDQLWLVNTSLPVDQWENIL